MAQPSVGMMWSSEAFGGSGSPDYQLAAIFRDELNERMRALGQLLGCLEREVDRPIERIEALESLGRTTHGLKSAARATGAGSVERLAHVLEEAIAAARSGVTPIDARWFDVAYNGIDALMLLRDRSVSGKRRDAVIGRAIADLAAIGADRAGRDEAGRSTLALDSPDVVKTLEGGYSTFPWEPVVDRPVAMSSMRDALGPIESIVDGLARESGKRVRVIVEGDRTPVDRRLVASMRDIVAHLVTNAIDHGIEEPDQREAAGKVAAGTIRIRVKAVSDHLDLVVSDDGAGIDACTLRSHAIYTGLLSTSAAAALDDGSALDLVFHHGFTTRNRVSRTSGRGIGLDAVRRVVADMAGELRLKSTPMLGTTFEVRVPAT